MSKKILLYDTGLFDYIDEKWKYIATDIDGNVYCYDDLPVYDGGGFDGGNHRYLGALNIDTSNVIAEESLLTRPQEIKVDMFGKFWNDDEEPDDHDAVWGFVGGIFDTCYYRGQNSFRYSHFKPGLPKELTK